MDKTDALSKNLGMLAAKERFNTLEGGIYKYSLILAFSPRRQNVKAMRKYFSQY